MKEKLFNKVYGCLLGGMIGDSMGGPTEGKPYWVLKERFGWVEDFEGCGTDDTALRTLLTNAILKNEGHVTADEWAGSFREADKVYYRLYYAPVRNMFHKIESKTVLPVYAGEGASPSSSSAMAISPMGILNACDPRAAAMETYDVAGLIHAGENVTFCRDGACAMAAAIAEAMKPDTDVEKILAASTAYLHKESSKVLLQAIEKTMNAVRSGMNYEKFREWFYENALETVICDARETIPAALAIFYLAEGKVEQTAIYAANFGRDSDTIGTMAASIAGAYEGALRIRKDWIEKIESYYGTVTSISGSATVYGEMELAVPDYREVAKQFCAVIEKRLEEKKQTICRLEELI